MFNEIDNWSTLNIWTNQLGMPHKMTRISVYYLHNCIIAKRQFKFIYENRSSHFFLSEYYVLLQTFFLFIYSYALVHVEIKNQGEDAFKHELYGDIIIVERRITESSGTTTVKNSQGFIY